MLALKAMTGGGGIGIPELRGCGTKTGGNGTLTEPEGAAGK